MAGKKQKFSVYILNMFKDGNFKNYYVGQTNDLDKRLSEHKANIKKKDIKTYTGRFDDVNLAKEFECNSRKEAILLEREIKKLSKNQKKNLINGTLPLKSLITKLK